MTDKFVWPPRHAGSVLCALYVTSADKMTIVLLRDFPINLSIDVVVVSVNNVNKLMSRDYIGLL